MNLFGKDLEGVAPRDYEDTEMIVEDNFVRNRARREAKRLEAEKEQEKEKK